jgi:hypothetical protein
MCNISAVGEQMARVEITHYREFSFAILNINLLSEKGT